jgi:hypothetical protein
VDSEVLSEVKSDLDLDRAFLRTDTRSGDTPAPTRPFTRLRAKDLLGPAFESSTFDDDAGQVYSSGATPIFDAIDKLCDPEPQQAEPEPQPQPEEATGHIPQPEFDPEPVLESSPEPERRSPPPAFAPPVAEPELTYVNRGQNSTPVPAFEAPSRPFENSVPETPTFDPASLVEPEAREIDNLAELWRNHRATIYVAIAGVILLLVLSGWVTWSPEPESVAPQPAPVRRQAAISKPAEPSPTIAPPAGRPTARVWLDVNTGLYYCNGSPLYGETEGGKFTTQDSARDGHYAPAGGQFCK